MLQQHLRVLQLLPQLSTENLHFLRAPAPGILVDPHRQGLKVVQELDEVEGPDLFELLVFGPGADGEGEGARFDVGEAGFGDPAFNLGAAYGLVNVSAIEGEKGVTLGLALCQTFAIHRRPCRPIGLVWSPSCTRHRVCRTECQSLHHVSRFRLGIYRTYLGIQPTPLALQTCMALVTPQESD